MGGAAVPRAAAARRAGHPLLHPEPEPRDPRHPPAAAPRVDRLPERSRLRIAVLLSGSGTSLESLLEQIDAGAVPGRVCVVVASKSNAFGLERARRRGIPAIAVPRKELPD